MLSDEDNEDDDILSNSANSLSSKHRKVSPNKISPRSKENITDEGMQSTTRSTSSVLHKVFYCWFSIPNQTPSKVKRKSRSRKKSISTRIPIFLAWDRVKKSKLKLAKKHRLEVEIRGKPTTGIYLETRMTYLVC